MQDVGKKLVGVQHYNKDGAINNRHGSLLSASVMLLVYVFLCGSIWFCMYSVLAYAFWIYNECFYELLINILLFLRCLFCWNLIYLKNLRSK